MKNIQIVVGSPGRKREQKDGRTEGKARKGRIARTFRKCFKFLLFITKLE